MRKKINNSEMSGRNMENLSFRSRFYFAIAQKIWPTSIVNTQFCIPILNLSLFRSLPAFPILAQGMVVGDRLFYYILSVIWLPHDQIQITIRRQLHSLDVSDSTISSSTQKSLKASYQGWIPNPDWTHNVLSHCATLLKRVQAWV